MFFVWLGFFCQIDLIDAFVVRLPEHAWPVPLSDTARAVLFAWDHGPAEAAAEAINGHVAHARCGAQDAAGPADAVFLLGDSSGGNHAVGVGAFEALLARLGVRMPEKLRLPLLQA